MKTKWYVATAVGVLGLTVAAIWGTAKVQAAPQKEAFVLKTWTRKDCSLVPWLVTDRLGYFAAEGIKMQYTGETQPALQIPSILRGNNDVASAHPNTMAVANAGGAKLVGVLRGGIEPAASYDPKFRHM